jgi:hypothetical protein
VTESTTAIPEAHKRRGKASSSHDTAEDGRRDKLNEESQTPVQDAITNNVS